MATEADQVRALQQAILDRARELSDEHIAQGGLTRSKIIADAREKIKLMEQKELLAAKLQSEREYQRLVQASELRVQAELDRNRWGLVQAVLDKLIRRLQGMRDDADAYEEMLVELLRQGVETIGQPKLVASLNNDDRARFHEDWDALVNKACGDKAKVSLSPEACACSGGVQLVGEAGDVKIDNTFEGIIARRRDALQRLIFERLFSTLATKGGLYDG